MNEIGFAIAAGADTDAGQAGAVIVKGAKADAGAKLDETAIIGGADIAGQPREPDTVIGVETETAARHPAHHPVGDILPVGGGLRCHREAQLPLCVAAVCLHIASCQEPAGAKKQCPGETRP